MNPSPTCVCPAEMLCTEDEVAHLIMSMDSNKANGPDGVSARMLKGTALAIAPSLTKLFNLSITTGCFPTCWKTSNVVPVPKSKTHSDCTQYRPISLLSIVSKLLEKHLHSYISLHLSVSHPISEKQWGFQSGRSTVSALLTVTHKWFKALDQGHEICSVFFDLRKAFDSVPHKMLLDKLVSYGLDKHYLNWVSSYLCNRRQCVVVGEELSMETRIVSGVPQGSVLGPLLFLLMMWPTFLYPMIAY